MSWIRKNARFPVPRSATSWAGPATNSCPSPGAGHPLYLREFAAIYYPSNNAWLWRQELPVDRDGRVRLRVPAPGSYAVRWRRQTPDPDDTWHTSIPSVFTVTQGPNPTVVELVIER